MKIYWKNSHPPYSFDVIRGLPEAKFYLAGWWHGAFRPLPANATLVTNNDTVLVELPKDTIFDVIINDYEDFWADCTITGHKKIHIFHCQNCHGGNPEMQAERERICEAVDAIVTPSEHKMMTYRELSFKYPFHVIPLGVSGEDYPLGSRDSGYIGIVHNSVSNHTEIDKWWTVASLLLGDRKKVLIGQNNGNRIGQYHNCDIWIPSGWEEYKKMIGSLSVFINCVGSEIAGYTPREVMASGVPVVTAIMTEFMECGFHGWNIWRHLGTTGDGVAYLADSAKYLIDNPDYAREIGYWGRETILRKYPLKRFQEMWRTLIYA